MFQSTIYLSFTPQQLASLRSHFAPGQFSNHVEIASRIDAAIKARDFFDALTETQQNEMIEICGECIRDDIDDVAKQTLLSDPDINEMKGYLEAPED